MRDQPELKGSICLDIDGTLTDQISSIPQPVVVTLEELHKEGWFIVFVTGRLYALAFDLLKSLNFPFFLAVQNGASWYEMPGQLCRGKKYLSLEQFLKIEPLLKGSGLDFVLISGGEEGSHCYYRPDHLKEETLNYFKNELSHFGGIWKPVLSFNSLELKVFPYAKVYGTKEELAAVQPLFSRFDFIKTYLVQDSVKPSHYLLQVMRNDVDKGKAVLDIMKSAVLSRPIIAAGNDLNDETLLSIADIKIVMANSPQTLLDQADLIAPPVERMGIIPALKEAIKQVQANDYS